MNNYDDWVIDGNYSRVAPERFNQADIIFNLKMNRMYCYLMAFKRYMNHRGQKRDSLGVTEKFDWEFQWWLLYKGRSRSIRKKRNELIAGSSAKIHIIKTRKQLNVLMNNIKERGL